jgi:hypothetical protein
VDAPDLNFRLLAVPAAVFVELLRDAGTPLQARDLKRRLGELGVPKQTVDAAWKRGQAGVKRHAHVVVDPARRTYAYSADRLPVPVSPAPVMAARLPVGPVLPAPRSEPGRRRASGRDEVTRTREARPSILGHDESHPRLAAARTVAEFAAEVEELAAAGATAAVLLERARALAAAFDVQPVGRPGEQVAFDPDRHAATGDRPERGAAAVVVRPGSAYVGGPRPVLVAKAQVVASRREAARVVSRSARHA